MEQIIEQLTLPILILSATIAFYSILMTVTSILDRRQNQKHLDRVIARSEQWRKEYEEEKKRRDQWWEHARPESFTEKVGAD